MKKLTTVSLHSLAIATLLAVSACGSAQPEQETPATGSADPSAAAAEEQAPEAPDFSNKVPGFTEAISVAEYSNEEGKVLPEKWEGGNGWESPLPENSNFPDTYEVIGEVIAYITDSDDEVESGRITEGNLIIADSSGEPVYTHEDEEHLSDVRNSLLKVTANGKTYLVHTRSGNTSPEADPNSVKKVEPKSVNTISVFTDEGEKLYTNDIEGTVSQELDAIVITHESEDQVLDVETGELSAVPAMDGHKWVGSLGGEDIFTKFVAYGDNGIITNGEWAIETLAQSDDDSDDFTLSRSGDAPKKLGSLLNVLTNEVNDSGKNLCALFDPATGENTGFLGGATGCFHEVSTSASGQYAVFTGGKYGGYYSSGDSGVIDTKTGKSFIVTDEYDFVITSVDDEGNVYGESTGLYADNAGKVASFNLNEDTEPQVLEGAEESPVSVTSGGLATFKTASGYYHVVPKS